ncbi:hypothetical protein L3Y34_012830 [Caenorhabditis briggsae]|uniref:SET domain-containing protein n=1 Tax=Caenorhabditis briggsae TaxID=6238 RepID=A0AAE8ZQ78_CAEBR|nr:hypothetical protein L3Y34_012830 [Caenorhabditis briggsae]
MPRKVGRPPKKLPSIQAMKSKLAKFDANCERNPNNRNLKEFLKVIGASKTGRRGRKTKAEMQELENSNQVVENRRMGNACASRKYLLMKKQRKETQDKEIRKLEKQNDKLKKTNGRIQSKLTVSIAVQLKSISDKVTEEHKDEYADLKKEVDELEEAFSTATKHGKCRIKLNKSLKSNDFKILKLKMEMKKGQKLQVYLKSVLDQQNQMNARNQNIPPLAVYNIPAAPAAIAPPVRDDDEEEVEKEEDDEEMNEDEKDEDEVVVVNVRTTRASAKAAAAEITPPAIMSANDADEEMDEDKEDEAVEIEEDEEVVVNVRTTRSSAKAATAAMTPPAIVSNDDKDEDIEEDEDMDEDLDENERGDDEKVEEDKDVAVSVRTTRSSAKAAAVAITPRAIMKDDDSDEEVEEDEDVVDNIRTTRSSTSAAAATITHFGRDDDEVQDVEEDQEVDVNAYVRATRSRFRNNTGSQLPSTSQTSQANNTDRYITPRLSDLNKIIENMSKNVRMVDWDENKVFVKAEKDRQNKVHQDPALEDYEVPLPKTPEDMNFREQAEKILAVRQGKNMNTGKVNLMRLQNRGSAIVAKTKKRVQLSANVTGNQSDVIPVYCDVAKSVKEATVPQTFAFKYSDRNVGNSLGLDEHFKKDVHMIKCDCHHQLPVVNCWENPNCPCYRMNINLRTAVRNTNIWEAEDSETEKEAYNVDLEFATFGPVAVHSTTFYDAVGLACSEECGCQGCCTNNVTMWLDKKIHSFVLERKDLNLGMQLATNNYIPAHTVISELTGEVVEQGNSDKPYSYSLNHGIDYGKVFGEELSKIVRRCSAHLKKLMEDTFEKFWDVDTKSVGNVARMMNHCCEPNVELIRIFQKGLSPSNLKLVAVTSKPVFPGEELTLDYGDGYKLDSGDLLVDVCRCGTLSCKSSPKMKLTVAQIEKKLKEDYEKKYAAHQIVLAKAAEN